MNTTESLAVSFPKCLQEPLLGNSVDKVVSSSLANTGLCTLRASGKAARSAWYWVRQKHGQRV